MKKTSEKVGAVENKPKVDYFQMFKEIPKHLRKKITMEEFHETIRQVRAKKLKKAS
jgi:hypothetical protein